MADDGALLTVFGVSALTFMMVMYGLEGRHSGFILAFALGCILASLYGFISGAWPFGVVEAVWALVALRRFGWRNDRSWPDDHQPDREHNGEEHEATPKHDEKPEVQ